MVSGYDFDTATALDLAREGLYRFLAAALADPRSAAAALAADPMSRVTARAAADLLRDEAEDDPVPLGFGERPPVALDLAAVLEELDRPEEDLAAEYDRVFGLVFARECPPYETEYCLHSEPFYRAQQLADVAAFYRAFGLAGASDRPERPDHLARELEFMAYLLMKQRLAAEEDWPDGGDLARVCADAARRFLADHLAWWAPSFAAGLRRKAGAGLYAELADVLAAFLPAERALFGVKAPTAPVRPAAPEPEEPSACAACPAGQA
jgi:TorA maturation chaperone TorD